MGSTFYIEGTATNPEDLQRIQNLILRTPALGYGQISSGMYDRFQNNDGIDTVHSVYILGSGYCTPVETTYTGNSQVAWSATVDSGYNTFANYGVRMTYKPENVWYGGNQVRVTLKAHETSSANFLHVCFAQWMGASYGCQAVGEFGDSTFKELKFSGNNGCSIAAGQTLTSDWLDFFVDATLPYMTIMSMSSATNNYAAGGGNDWAYFKANGASDYNVANPGGYDGAQAAYFTSQVEVRTYWPVQGMSLISVPRIESSAVSFARATVLVRNFDSSTKIYVSSSWDSPPTWTELTNLTLVASDVESPNVSQYTSDLVAVSGSEGQPMRWKMTTDAGNSTQCYGVSLSWK
jgi:hypothetical protein